jgi:hypothetical protein
VAIEVEAVKPGPASSAVDAADLIGNRVAFGRPRAGVYLKILRNSSDLGNALQQGRVSHRRWGDNPGKEDNVHEFEPVRQHR